MNRMTKLGKGLVIANLVLSVVLAGWALGIYTSQHQGAEPAAAGAKPATTGGKAHNRAQAEVFDLQAKVATLNKSLTEATGRWQTAHAYLVRLEAPYYANPPWYNAQLQDIEIGTGPLQTVSYESGQIVLDPKNYGRPLLVPAYDPPLAKRAQGAAGGEQLRSASFYRPKIAEALDAQRKLSQQFNELVKQDTDLTEQLSGKPPATKGLWTRLGEEEAKQKQIRAEAEDLNDSWTKYQVDADALQRRQQQIQERIGELEQKVAARTARP
jgi:hypothetical protein